jgi:hypothetical protein
MRAIALRLRSDRGMTTVGTLLAIGFTMIAAVFMLQLLLFMYGRMVIRSAVDEGVRAGSRVDAGVSVCEARANDVLSDLIGGPLGSGISVGCGLSGGQLIAQANATLDSPLPGIPSWSFSMGARAVQEERP